MIQKGAGQAEGMLKQPQKQGLQSRIAEEPSLGVDFKIDVTVSDGPKPRETTNGQQGQKDALVWTYWKSQSIVGLPISSRI